MKGFVLTDEVKEKVKETQTAVNELVKNEGILRMDKNAVEKLFREHQQKYNFIEFMGLIDSKGYLTFSTVEVPENHRDASAKPYFIKACQGEAYVSEEYISVATNNYNISVTVPFQRGGIFGGLIIADININEN